MYTFWGSVNSATKACNAVISACEKCEKWQHACLLLSEAYGRMILPNVVTFNAAISACGAAGEWGLSLSLLRRMGPERLHADMVSYNAVITAFERGCQWELAWQLLSEIEQQSGDGDAPRLKVLIGGSQRADRFAQEPT